MRKAEPHSQGTPARQGPAAPEGRGLTSEAERELVRLRAVLENLQEAVVLNAPDGQLLEMNPAALRLHGFQSQAEIPTSLQDLVALFEVRDDSGEFIPADQWPLARAMRGERVEKALRRVRRRDTGRSWIGQYTAELLRDAQGRPLLLMTAITDLTERLRTQEALKEADKHKDEFLAILSHELRNPLAPIRNSLYVLRHSPPGSPAAERSLGVIDRQVGHMTRLIDDLLDVTRIARGKVQLQTARLELGELVRRTAEDHQGEFSASGVELVVRLAESPLWVEGDATRLAQVLGNLLQNAVKFTPRGGRVEVSLEGDWPARRARLEVSDTGTGIAPEVLPRLFQPFTQADQSLDRSRGGLGLGLALVKGLVELHRGEVSAQSGGLGAGARFVVTLPLQAESAARNSRGSRADGLAPATVFRRRVLLIEDNLDSAETLREALTLDGHTVSVAHDGPEGLAAAVRSPPDVVLCDIGLPGMDGYQVARAMRTNPALRETFLIALTGYALPEDQRRAREVGFDRHVAKPPSLEVLEQVIQSAPGRHGAQAQATPAPQVRSS